MNKYSYIIIERNSIDELIDEVNEFARNGWMPVGGVTVFLRSYKKEDTANYPYIDTVYLQVLIFSSKE